MVAAFVCQDGTVTRAQTWGGRTADERRAERHARLIEAALEIWGESGWAAVTMRGVCARAGLIDRYFYESFADRDALLVAVWEGIRNEMTAAMVSTFETSPDESPIVLLHRVVTVVVHDLTDDPRRAQILLGDHSGSAVLESRRREMVVGVTAVAVDLGAKFVRSDIDRADFRNSTLMAVGGVFELINAWHNGDIDLDADGIIEHATKFGRILGAYYLP